MSCWSRGHFVADHSGELCLALLEIVILVRRFRAPLLQPPAMSAVSEILFAASQSTSDRDSVVRWRRKRLLNTAVRV
jgi:hypothetical protein